MGNTTSVTQWLPLLSHWSWVCLWGMVSTTYITTYGILLQIFCNLLIILFFSVPPAFSVSQPYFAVGVQGQVSFHCTINAKNQPEEMRVSVYKGQYGEQRICSAFVNISDPHIETNGEVFCRGNVSKGQVDLTIFGLRGKDTDIYRCKIDFLFPPPYVGKFGNGTLVYVQGKRCC